MSSSPLEQKKKMASEFLYRQLVSTEKSEENAAEFLRDKKQKEYKEYFGKKQETGMIEIDFEKKTHGVVVNHTIKKGIAMF